MNREDVISRVLEEKVIAIARGITLEQCARTAQALYEGGIRLMEVTFDASGRTPVSDTAQAVSAILEALDGKMLVGAGTVLNEAQVKAACQAGATYIISPDTNEAVIKKTVELGMVSIPGALTPTEAAAASRMGADFIKIFPAAQLGTSYIKAIRSPLSHIRLLAVGGISDANVADYLKAGCCGAGIGGNLVSKKLIDAGDYSGITKIARQTVAAVKSKEVN